MGPATVAEVGLWIVCFFGVMTGCLTVLWLSRQLWISFNPPPKVRDGDEEYVTRRELLSAIEKIETVVSQFVSRKEYEIRHAELEKRLTQLDEYLHQRMHDLLNCVNVISNRLEVLALGMERERGRQEGRKELGTDKIKRPEEA